MWLNFSKIEIMILEWLCEGSASPGELTVSLGKKNSFISRALGKLIEKGMASKSGHAVSLSASAHAQGFKKLYDTRPNAKIENWLCGSSMDVLIALADFESGVEPETLAREIDCSKPTMFKILKLLYGVGVASKLGSRVLIGDAFVRDFAESYANSLQQLLVSRAHGHNVSIRVRKNVVVRTDAKEVPSFFSETGINALAGLGLAATKTSYNDYTFNLGMTVAKVGAEEAFVHALLLTTIQQHQDKTVLALFLMKNRGRLSIAQLRKLAKEYHVEGELATMRQALDYAEKAG